MACFSLRFNSSVPRARLTRKPVTEGLSVSVKWGKKAKCEPIKKNVSSI